MSTLIKEITNIDAQGVGFTLTEKVPLNGGMSAKQWWVSWDHIGKALFGEDYSDAESVKELRIARGEDNV